MRYFIEVKYKGTHYAGFQIQNNAATIQSEVQRVLKIYFKKEFKLTGSSRTDAGVHANQNFFQCDFDSELPEKILYNLNALLPYDIAIKSIAQVNEDAHARFDALSREYIYNIYSIKNPFSFETAWFYPYTLDFNALQSAAAILMQHRDFTTFAKRNSEVNTYNCTIFNSEWFQNDAGLSYQVKANRFLRGMVRGMVGTMLQVGRGALSIEKFNQVIVAKDCTKANFATPPHGLFLNQVAYPPSVFRI